MPGFCQVRRAPLNVASGGFRVTIPLSIRLAQPDRSDGAQLRRTAFLWSDNPKDPYSCPSAPPLRLPLRPRTLT